MPRRNRSMSTATATTVLFMAIATMYPPELELQTSTNLRLAVRPLRADDRELLLRSFEALSPESRYKRFFSPMPQLGGPVLDSLLNIDQHDHLALGATEPVGSGRELVQGVGVVRAIRSATDPSSAEFAITVVDDYQRQGVASLLMRSMAAVALDHGITNFHGEILTTNRGMRSMITHLGGTLDRMPGDRTVVQAHLSCVELANQLDPQVRPELVALFRHR